MSVHGAERSWYRIICLISIVLRPRIHFHIFFKLLPRIGREENIDYYVYFRLPVTIFSAACFFSMHVEFVFLSVFIMALILHSTDYFMLHFAPCRCSMSFIMISMLEHKQLANRPKEQWTIFSYLSAAATTEMLMTKKIYCKRGEVKPNLSRPTTNA